jgi:hypothetical protein
MAQQWGVWADEAMHRASNLRHLATNLERLLDSGRIESSNRSTTLRRANALVSAYQNLDRAAAAGPRSCAGDLSDIAGGLVEIFGHVVGSIVLSLDVQSLRLGAALCCWPYLNLWSMHCGMPLQADRQEPFGSPFVTTRQVRRVC